jgi:hypothetical protein
MRTATALWIGIALGLSSQAALAFQETGGKAASPDAQTTPSIELAQPGGKPGLNLSVPETKGKTSGPEIRVPGLGMIGVLPKLDFGLELLYGANDQKGVRDDKAAEPADLQIRGTVKYKFGN